MSHRDARRWLLVAALGFATMAALAANLLESVSPTERTAGLKSALTQAAQVAVGQLGKTDGFLGNPEVRIPLPGKLEKAKRTLKMLGLSKQTDELVTAMNRAAEAAVPEAKSLLVDTVKQMSVTDAVAILTGGPDAATQYFKTATSARLTEKFLPIVSRATQKVQLAQRYNEVGGRLQKLGVVSAADANLDSYVTSKALDGLFLMMAKEEAAIRKDPLGQSSSILKKVFGALPR